MYFTGGMPIVNLYVFRTGMKRPATAADAVFSPFTPVFRASAVDATDNPYAINVFETPFPLLTPPPGTDSHHDEPPGTVRKP